MKGNKPIWAIGCMSGTSMDGVDIAELLTDGERIKKFGNLSMGFYDAERRAILEAAVGSWPGDESVAEAERVILELHEEMLTDSFRGSLIGFHGQTLVHDPDNGRTHQVGNGQDLADLMGITTVWDFRARDMELGGQGAPLTPFFHFAIAKYLGETSPVVFLNLGGIANLTWVNAAEPLPEAPGALVAFDTGPANTLIDSLMQSRSGSFYDIGGKVSGSGEVDEELLSELMKAPYFSVAPPKSLDRSHFMYSLDAMAHLSLEDAAATLAEFTARSIAEGFRHFPAVPSKVIASGGGVYNKDLMKRLANALPAEIVTADSVGLSSFALEAFAFGFLAVRVLRGLPITSPSTTGCAKPAVGARISRPSETRDR